MGCTHSAGGDDDASFADDRAERHRAFEQKYGPEREDDGSVDLAEKDAGIMLPRAVHEKSASVAKWVDAVMSASNSEYLPSSAGTSVNERFFAADSSTRRPAAALDGLRSDEETAADEEEDVDLPGIPLMLT